MNYEIKVLSLKRRTDRREFITKQIDGKHPFSFFDAIDGKELIITPYIENYFKNTDYHLWNIDRKCMISHFLSNVEMWKESIKNNKNLCIFEDDTNIDPNEIDEIDELFQMDFDIYIMVKRWIPNSYSYLVKPEGAKKLIDYFDNNKATQSLDWELAKLDGNELFKVLWSDRDKFSKSCDRIISKSDIIEGGEIYIKIA
jgi:GR25 family glycosyltransferase involved in LPS biosynthesis